MKSSVKSPFRYFNSSEDVIRIAVMMYVRYPLSLRQVEDILFERGIDISYETVRYWWTRFGPLFAAEIRKRRRMDRKFSCWRWHVDEVFVKINGELHYLWRAVDEFGEVLEFYVSKTRDKATALKFLKKVMKRYGKPEAIVTDKLPSYGAALKDIGNARRQESGKRLNNRCENSHLPFRRREYAMLKFRKRATLQKFVAAHAQVYNHFNSDRHNFRISRKIYKQRRSDRLAEWRAGAF